MELWFTEHHTPNVRFSIKVDRQLYSGRSEFQRIDIFDSKEFGRFLTLDGYMMLTEMDEFIYHEMITHVPMCVNPDEHDILVIGGEHLVTLPAFRAVHEKYPDVAVIHFDAHTDLREEYLGNRLSHATVIRRIWEIIGDGRIFQFGIRSGERAEWYWSAEGHTKIQKFSVAGLDETIAALKGRPVYLTIDLDVLDPSCFPGTGTPEAGGVRFTDLLSAALRTIRGGEIVGCDMVELSPPLDPSGTSTATALKLLREMLLALEKPYLK